MTLTVTKPGKVNPCLQVNITPKTLRSIEALIERKKLRNKAKKEYVASWRAKRKEHQQTPL